MVAAITNILKETRSYILVSLKKEGRLSVDQISAAVGVSKVSVRRHLDLLSRDGLVDFEVERHERGRPGHIYFLTPKAEMLFPTGYDAFALDVLRQVRTLFGERAVSRVLGGKTDLFLASLKPQLEGLGFDERVKKLFALIDERGYDVALRKLRDGSYMVRQRNCPVVAVASVYNQVCNEELRLYRELLGTEVFRDCRIAGGARSCDYRILPPNKDLNQMVRLSVKRKKRQGVRCKPQQ